MLLPLSGPSSLVFPGFASPSPCARPEREVPEPRRGRVLGCRRCWPARPGRGSRHRLESFSCPRVCRFALEGRRAELRGRSEGESFRPVPGLRSWRPSSLLGILGRPDRREVGAGEPVLHFDSSRALLESQENQMASGDFCSPGEGMEILQQVCSKQLPPCNLSKEDLLQNPYFSKLLLNLSQRVDESGLSLTLAKEQAQAWKEVRLHKTTWLRSEILHRVIQELLVDYYVKIQDTNVTSEDKKFHETLEQRLLVTELMRLLGPSQEREIPPLLGLEKADLLELMPLSEDFVWMRARLQQEVEEQLKKKCFSLLCYYDPNSDADSETVKAAKVWKLTEVLVGEQQQCQDAKSQQKEQMLLLEKKSATYSQVLLRCLTLLQRLLQEHRLKTQSELDRINAQYLEVKCGAMILKLRMEELKILSDTYTAEKVEVHRLIRDRLEGAIHLQEQDMEKSRQVLNSYEVLGEEFDRLVKEYTVLKQATENKRWALQEFNKAYH
ncbi:HAUS augmin-like complex subunit 4 isoform X2 [Pongo pygmaeus]|nr:HAUS augmin-like complex subunit 4 isoform X2 [Pongo abelii]XP_054304825.1 HAUS augmin-like complex subunit 4 isoform X2 [Pongo pygmaeus]